MARTPVAQRSVTYGSVGGTQAVDLMQYPPKGHRPAEYRARIGHGEARWQYACDQVLTWGIQHNAGMRVERVPAADGFADSGYQPVRFDDDGVPVEAAELGSEPQYTADGVQLTFPGETIVLHVPVLGLFRVTAPARVVLIVDEPDRRGFAYGTLPGHPESGEELFVVERTEDGSVWLSIRAFSRPAHAGWRLVAPALRLFQETWSRRYLRALAGPIGVDSDAALEAPRDAQDD